MAEELACNWTWRPNLARSTSTFQGCLSRRLHERPVTPKGAPIQLTILLLSITTTLLQTCDQRPVHDPTGLSDFCNLHYRWSYFRTTVYSFKVSDTLATTQRRAVNDNLQDGRHGSLSKSKDFSQITEENDESTGPSDTIRDHRGSQSCADGEACEQMEWGNLVE